MAKAIGLANKIEVIRCHVRLPRGEALARAKRGAILIKAGDVESARALCNNGVIFEAEIFVAEPYTSLQP